MVFPNGLLITDGQVQCLDATAGIESDSSIVGGWVLDPTGEGYIENLESSAVPAAAVIIGGIAFGADGRMYVTTDAPSGAAFIGGFAVRSDGALHVSTTSPDSADPRIGGIAVTAAGVARFFFSVGEGGDFAMDFSDANNSMYFPAVYK